MRLYWLQSPSSALFMIFDAILLPAMIFYFGTRVAPHDRSALERYLAGGISTGMGIGATTRVGLALLSDVQLGRLELLRAVNVGRAAYVGAHVGTALLFSLLSVFAGVSLLAAIGLASFRVSDLATLFVVACACGGAMGALGAAIAMASRDYASGHGWLSIASLGLAFLSPVFYDASLLPRVLVPLTWLSPFTHAAALVGAVLAAEPIPWWHLVAVVGGAVALNLYVLRALPWTAPPRRREPGGEAADAGAWREVSSGSFRPSAPSRVLPQQRRTQGSAVTLFARQVAGVLRLRLLGVLRALPQRLTYGLALPWIFMAIIGSSDRAGSALQLAFGGAVLSACFVLMRAPAATLVDDRLHGFTSLLSSVGGATTAVSATAHALGLLALAVMPTLVFVSAVRSEATPASPFWWVPLALTLVALHGIGMCFARARPTLMGLLLATDLTIAALVVLCPIFYALDAVPGALRPIMDLLPPTLGISATRDLWAGQHVPWASMLLLGLWSAVLCGFGYWRFPP